jgi:hypothetical protein
MTATHMTSACDRSGKVNFEDPQQGSPALPSVEDIMSMGDADMVEGQPPGRIPAALFQVSKLGLHAHCTALQLRCCRQWLQRDSLLIGAAETMVELHTEPRLS